MPVKTLVMSTKLLWFLEVAGAHRKWDGFSPKNGNCLDRNLKT